ncbi:MAG TPA: TPM domain-containing protein, partial [Pyrinomonadaceae bacterium]|nr:TPM domain-containing protein [Pyrinomonadaceae bacterium]
MIPSYVLKRVLMVLPAIGLFLLVSTNPLAQSQKFPAPTTYVSDFAGVIDAETKSRLESLLQKLKEKSKIDLYVATVESTGEQTIS